MSNSWRYTSSPIPPPALSISVTALSCVCTCTGSSGGNDGAASSFVVVNLSLAVEGQVPHDTSVCCHKEREEGRKGGVRGMQRSGRKREDEKEM